MKHFQLLVFTALLISGFQSLLFANETPSGHVLTINSVTFNNLRTGFSDSTNTLFVAHVKKFFGQTDMYSGEHYYVDYIEGVNNDETREVNHNIFLDADHGKVNESYSVCFEFKNVGTSCDLIKAEDIKNGKLELTDHNQVFATLDFTLSEACLDEITPENVKEYKEVLLRFNSMKMNFFSGNGLQIRLSEFVENTSSLYGWIGDRGYRYIASRNDDYKKRHTNSNA